MQTPTAVIRCAHLQPAEVAEVLALARTASDTDGTDPLSEHVMLHVRHGGDDPSVHLLVRADDGGELVGYAHVDTTDLVDGPAAELVVHPLYRRRGLGRALVLAAIAAAEEGDPQGRLRLWAHGDHPSAGALSLSLGFERFRVLLQMRRSLEVPLPAAELPAGVRLRSFQPGQDDEAWLALNARAFAHHPEQGRWGLDDLRIRLAEPWFDPAGFLLAERVADGRLLGFHWTKVHGHERPEPEHARSDRPEHAGSDGQERSRSHGHEPIGEVYILGVDPTAGGGGLGATLTVAGLHHLRSRGLSQAMLYVDESNPRAVRLYERLGFARWSTDACFRRVRPTS